MPQEFREGGSGEQNQRVPQPARRGGIPSGSGARLGLLAVTTLAVAAVGAWWARERPRELAPGIPLPPFARLVPDPGLEPPPGDGCRLALFLPEAIEAARSSWEERVEAAGWEPAGAEGGDARSVYRRPGGRMLAAVEADGDGTRVRVTLRPCPAELADGSRPEIVLAGR